MRPTLPVDSHCHLTDFKDIPGAIARAREEAGAVFTCGYSRETSLSGLGLAKSNPGFVYAIAGESPQRVMDSPEVELGWLQELVGIVAIGEIGLDRHWGKTEGQLGNQREWFGAQLELARKRGLPVVIHSRDAETEVLDMLEAHGVKKALLHCFSGKPADAKRGTDMGYFLTVPPNNSKARRKIIKSVDTDYLMLESDSPYIGKTPGSVADSARSIAEIKGIPFEKAVGITAENALKFYGVE